MKNRGILTATLSLLAFCGLSRTEAGPDVTVDNTETHPIPIVGTVGIAENPARRAVQQNLTIGGPTSITIPAGKIFVLEFVSFQFLYSGAARTLDTIGLSVSDPLISGGQGTVSYWLAIPPTPINSGVTEGGQALRLYAQPGTTLSIIWTVGGGVGGFPILSVSLSGYFVNAQ